MKVFSVNIAKHLYFGNLILERKLQQMTVCQFNIKVNYFISDAVKPLVTEIFDKEHHLYSIMRATHPCRWNTISV
jgi:DNA-binding MltR family transcriptional regulator